MDIVETLLYPGLTFILALAVLAWFYEWLDRKFPTYAGNFLVKLENRYGLIHAGVHGLLRRLADFRWLFAEVRVCVDKPLIKGVPIPVLVLPLTALFLIPVSGVKAFFHFEGDLIVTIFIMNLLAILAFMGGWSSTNRCNTIVGMRAAMQTLGYGVPLAIVLIGPAIAARSLSISEIVQWQATHGLWIIALAPIGFGITIIGILAELEKAPFDVSKAATETLAELQTQSSARKVELVRLALGLELALATSLITALFLGGPSGPIAVIPDIVWFLIKSALVVLVLSWLRALFIRLRIGKMIGNSWKRLMPLAILQIIVLGILFM